MIDWLEVHFVKFNRRMIRVMRNYGVVSFLWSFPNFSFFWVKMPSVLNALLLTNYRVEVVAALLINTLVSLSSLCWGRVFCHYLTSIVSFSKHTNQLLLILIVLNSKRATSIIESERLKLVWSFYLLLYLVIDLLFLHLSGLGSFFLQVLKVTWPYSIANCKHLLLLTVVNTASKPSNRTMLRLLINFCLVNILVWVECSIKWQAFIEPRRVILLSFLFLKLLFLLYKGSLMETFRFDLAISNYPIRSSMNVKAFAHVFKSLRRLSFWLIALFWFVIRHKNG